MRTTIAALAALLLAAAPASAQLQINPNFVMPPGGLQVANLPLVVPPAPGAPGPAGILGAAAAWHAARRLRRRMRGGRP